MRRSLLLAAIAALTALPSCSPARNNFDASGGDPDADNGSLDATGDAATDDAALDVPLSERPYRCPGDGTGVSGTVFAPNGVDPIAGAHVYVLTDPPAAFTPGAQCETCMQPAGALAFAETGIDGVFSLTHVLDTGGSAYVVIQKGRFRKVVPVTFTDCGSAVALTSVQTRLPGNTQDGDMPRILVASGTDAEQVIPHPRGADYVYDNIARVLSRVGITEFDRAHPCRLAVPGDDLTATTCEFGNVLADPARLMQYDIVFAPCGALGFNHSWQLLGEAQNQAIVNNVRAFLQAGGRLYTSDTAYGLIERVSPSTVQFVGDDTGTLVNNGKDPANVGYGGSPTAPGSYAGTAEDTDLHDWLRDRGALSANDTLALTGFISPWAAVDSIPTSTRLWVDGAVDWFDTTTTGVHYPAGVHPLTVTADYRDATTGVGCGRVGFTSYEVNAPMSQPDLTPQERVLEWLLFELGGCVLTPG